jgi:hypothetical protein
MLVLRRKAWPDLLWHASLSCVGQTFAVKSTGSCVNVPSPPEVRNSLPRYSRRVKMKDVLLGDVKRSTSVDSQLKRIGGHEGIRVCLPPWLS